MGPLAPPRRPRLRGWHTAAALLWFEVFGAAGLFVVALAASWSRTWNDGSVVAGVVALVGGCLVSLIAWLARPPEVRAAIYLALGVAGVVAIGLSATAGVVAFLAFSFWLGWPSAALIVVWGQVLREVGRPVPPS